MQNRITFSNVIGVLLENKKKTYAQYQMIEDIFYACLCNMDLFEKEDFEKNVTYSRWCTGERPIPKEILCFYDNCGFDGIQDNIQDDVIEYSCAAEPPVRGGVSHLSRRNEPL